MTEGPMEFANLRWQSRWNAATAVASTSQNRNELVVSTLFGPEDTVAIVTAARAFADLLEKTQQKYTEATHEEDLRKPTEETMRYYLVAVADVDAAAFESDVAERRDITVDAIRLPEAVGDELWKEHG